MRTSAFPPAPDCPIAPGARKSVYARALHRACRIIGGVDALAAYLEVTSSDLVRWLQGVEEPPYDAFLRAVEAILLDLDAPRGRE